MRGQASLERVSSFINPIGMFLIFFGRESR